VARRRDGADEVAAARAGVSRPTVYTWVRPTGRWVSTVFRTGRPGKAPQVLGSVRARILALIRTTPPSHTGAVALVQPGDGPLPQTPRGIDLSHNFIADLWRDNGLQRHRTGTFKVPLSADPDFEAKVFDVVGLYLSPPEGAVVLSFREKTQVQALDRTQPLLPIDFAHAEKLAHP
jgi:hypothetical protein